MGAGAVYLYLLALLGLTIGSAAQMNFFAISGGDVAFDNSISAPCMTALNATLSCPSQFTSYPNSDYGGPFSTTELDAFCSAKCVDSLSSYRASVSNDCSTDPPIFDGVPATFIGDRMEAYQKRTCFKDKISGEYCNTINAKWTQALPQQDTAFADLPKQYLCSYCYLSLLQAIQSTPYSNYDESFVESYQKAQRVCGITYPTEPQKWPFNVTSDSPPSSEGTSSGGNLTKSCVSGKQATVSAAQSCQDIAGTNGVSTGTLRLVNNIFPDCSNLHTFSTLCLPLPCSTATVKDNQTCFDIANAANIGFTDVRAYNPAIDYDCSNLVSGESVCVSPPGGNFTPTAIPGAGLASSATFATATVKPPGSTPKGTTPQCGKYYQAQPGDICQQISLNNTIMVDLLEAINPAIDKACDNIVPGLFYCVLPMADWNTTQSSNPSSSTVVSTAASAPGPTPSGTTDTCSKWHLVISGDTCYGIEQQEGITIDQLIAWNPSLKADCSNLLKDEAYCVAGPSSGSP